LKALLTELDLTLDIETQLADERLDLRLSRQNRSGPAINLQPPANRSPISD